MDLENMWKVKKLEITAHLDHLYIMTERYINGFRDTPLAEKHVKFMKSHNRNMSICLSIIPLAYKNEQYNRPRT